MKPKNRIWCPDCNRPKMLFESERKANDFIKWNGDDLPKDGDKLRAYYCPSCCGWHLSHRAHKSEYDNRTDRLIGAYRNTFKNREEKRIDKLLSNYGERLAIQAAKIFDELPEEARRTELKWYLKEALSRYFKENGITDSCGELRAEVYRVWQQSKSK